MCNIGKIISISGLETLGYGRNEEGVRYKLIRCRKCGNKYRRYTVITHELELVEED